jgi:hypothetical protein
MRRRWATAVLAWAAFDAVLLLLAALAHAQVFGDFTGEPGITPGTGIVVTDPGLGVPGISIADTAVTPGTYGDATDVGQFTVDKQGRLTSAVNVPITGPISATTSVDTLFWLAGWQ